VSTVLRQACSSGCRFRGWFQFHKMIPIIPVVAGDQLLNLNAWTCQVSLKCAFSFEAGFLTECLGFAGQHWCYRLQLYTYNGTQTYNGSTDPADAGLFGGDYLWNVSQNVPSLPIPWQPLCTTGIKNCSCVLPLATVEIPIVSPPGGNECHPSKTCNVCPACCARSRMNSCCACLQN
jgi:hypothetical protein